MVGLLRAEGEHRLAGSVPGLRFYEWCGCPDDFCSSFYTGPRPAHPYGPEHRNVVLSPHDCMMVLDVVSHAIRYVEILYRGTLR
ncbi:hypothetical protein DPM19_05770 [Actinomadura craniellae]|uniref:Uncharacterized protein n=1 Tax=Actinomadura craniellae TaxID=2231787 RepID=A0A365HBW4_9ACTN|nr:hypothetical protein DPM19_05770 [Actinomadura craniellae]